MCFTLGAYDDQQKVLPNHRVRKERLVISKLCLTGSWLSFQ